MRSPVGLEDWLDMPGAICRTLQVAMLVLPLTACGDPLRLVLVEAGGSNALSQGGSDNAGTGGTPGSMPARDPCAPPAPDQAPWDVPALYTASYVSVAYPGQYMRYIETDGFIGAIDMASTPDKEGATFEVIPGVWDCKCISLRALNQIGALFRHSGSRIYMHPASEEPLYLADATFCPEPGFADGAALSFRSVNYPQRLIHLRNQNELWIDDIVATPPATIEQAALFASEVTFRQETALLER